MIGRAQGWRDAPPPSAAGGLDHARSPVCWLCKRSVEDRARWRRARSADQLCDRSPSLSWLGSKIVEATKGLSGTSLRAAIRSVILIAARQPSFETVPRSIAVEVTAPPVRDTAEIEAAIAKLGRELGGGLIVAPDGFTTVHQHLFIRLAQHSLVNACSASTPRSALPAAKFSSVPTPTWDFGCDQRESMRALVACANGQLVAAVNKAGV